MSHNPIINQTRSTDKDPPPVSPSSPPSILRAPPSIQNPRQLSSSPKDSSKGSMPPPPPSRPSINTRTTSFDPNPQIFNPRVVVPEVAVEDASHSIHASTTTTTHFPTATTSQQEFRRRNFAPFFTLVNDIDSSTEGNDSGTTSTGAATYHPHKIHYIFSDDEGGEVDGLLTDALLRADSQQNERITEEENTTTSPEEEDGEGDEEAEVLSRGSLERSISDRERPTTGGTTTTTTTTTTSSSSSATFKRQDNRQQRKKKVSSTVPRKVENTITTAGGGGNVKGKGRPREREERIVIVDINESLDKVEKITSLSKDWQVLNASIDRAPSFDPTTTVEGNAEDDDEKGLMLRIEGVSIARLRGAGGGGGGEEGGKGLGLRESVSAGGTGTATGMSEEEMQVLMERFDRKMAVLRRVVGSFPPPTPLPLPVHPPPAGGEVVMEEGREDGVFK